MSLLLELKRFDRIQLRRTGCRKCAENYTHQCCGSQRNDCRKPGYGDAVRRKKSDRIGNGQAKDGTDDAAAERNKDRLNEELQFYFAVRRTQSLADANLPDARTYV